MGLRDGPRLKDEALGFDANAGAYERARPSYPPEAVAYVVGRGGIGPRRQVVDLAAGTGKLTRLLVLTGAEVTAVEPVAGMRARLARAVAGAEPAVDVLDGTAEALPVGDRTADVVTVAQAFHWFDPPAALAEIARVLRPGGHLFLLWNARDNTTGWVDAFEDVVSTDPGPGGAAVPAGDRAPGGGAAPGAGRGTDPGTGRDGGGGRAGRRPRAPFDWYHDVDYAAVVADAGAGAFGPVEVWRHAWSQPCDEGLLVDAAESVSVVGTLGPERRAIVLDRVRTLARTHPDLAGRATFPFPFTTMVWHCRRR